MREDALSQAMLKVLQKVVGAQTRSGSRGSVTKRLRSNGAKLFRDVTGVTLIMVEYWLEATKIIMNDLDCTPEQKLKVAVYLLREAYQWW